MWAHRRTSRSLERERPIDDQDRSTGGSPSWDYRERARQFWSGWPALRVAHLFVGIGAFYAFGRSGQFMDQQLDHLVGMPDGPRALYRSGHIYLLFTALIHLLLGIYLVPSASFLGRSAQFAGSAFLFSALWLFITGFYVETPLGLVERPSVRAAIKFSLNGVFFHGLGAVLLWWLPSTLMEMLPWSLRQRFDRTGGPS